MAEPSADLGDQAGRAAEDGGPGWVGKSCDQDLAILERFYLRWAVQYAGGSQRPAVTSNDQALEVGGAGSELFGYRGGIELLEVGHGELRFQGDLREELAFFQALRGEGSQRGAGGIAIDAVELFKLKLEDLSIHLEAAVELEQQPAQERELAQAVMLRLLLEALELAGPIGGYRGDGR